MSCPFLAKEATMRLGLIGLGRIGAFHADTVLVKHSSEYRPPAPGEVPGPAHLETGG